MEEAKTEEREARRQASNSRVSSANAPSILNLEVGLKVLIQDKITKKFVIPGEIVEVKSERSAIVRNSDTGNLMLRNRRFLRNRIQNQRRCENSVARLTLRQYVSQVCCALAFP